MRHTFYYTENVENETPATPAGAVVSIAGDVSVGYMGQM